MKTKIVILSFLITLSVQLSAQENTGSNGTADLDVPNFIRVYSVDAIGGEQVETYKNNNNQYFYNPLIIVDWKNFKKQLDQYNTQAESAAIKLLLKVYHYDKNVYNELKMLLERDEHVININLSNLPYTYFILKARVGSEYLILNPTDLPTFSTVSNFQVKHMINRERNYELTGTLKQLKEFYNFRGSNENLKGSLYMGGFEFSSDYIKGSADFANSSTIKKKLFGDETLIDNQIVNSSGKQGGLSLSLGPLKLGGGKVESKVWTENEKKRVLNRNYVSDLITNNQSEIHILSMGDADKIRETKNQIINYLLEKISSQVTLEFQKISDNEYNLVKNTIVYATLKNEQVEKLLKSKPEKEFTSGSEQTATVSGVSASNKDNITSKGGDDITWQYKGSEWIPTKVDMYILSDYQLKNSLSIDALSYNKEGKKTIEIPFIYPAAWLEDDTQITNTNIVDRDNPIGTVLAFAANTDKIPAGWQLCNGDVLPVHGNEALFNVIGYNWGKQSNGDFNLPDLRGVFQRGVDNNRKIDLDRLNSTNKGLIVNDLQQDALQEHKHSTPSMYLNNGNGQPYRLLGEDGVGYGGHIIPVIFSGALEARVSAVETRPTNVAVNYIIRCK